MIQEEGVYIIKAYDHVVLSLKVKVMQALDTYVYIICFPIHIGTWHPFSYPCVHCTGATRGTRAPPLAQRASTKY